MSDDDRWVDLGVEGAVVALADYVGTPGAEGRYACVFSRHGFQPGVAAALGAKGFLPSDDNPKLMGRPGGKFKMSDVRDAYPDAVVVPRPKALNEARQIRKPAPFVGGARAAPAAMVTEGTRPVPVVHPAARLPAETPQPFRPVGRVRLGVAQVTDAPTPPLPIPAVEPAQATSAARAGDVRGLAVEPAASSSPGAEAGDGPPKSPRRVRQDVAAPDRVPARKGAERAKPPVPEPGEDVQRPVLTQPKGGFADPDQINPFQKLYRPASRLGRPIATIPLNLAGPTARALAKAEAAHGPVDAFVAARLQWTPERMAQLLSPEQVDAVALALHSASRGQGFVLADMTGLGKGRVLAAIARGVVLAGEPVIFVTEKENLFSDFWRDVTDIDSCEVFGRPLMINDGGRIVDTSSAEGAVIHAPWNKREVTEVIRRKRLPPGCKLVMASYSQFNRPASPKAEFLVAVARRHHLVCDECHNAVGDSATSENMARAMDGAAAVTYSSATFARHAGNLAAYRRLYPQSMRSSDIMDVLKTGGQAISEALSQMLAEDGSYLRREHDMSDLSIAVVDDTRRLDRNKAMSDELAPILARVGRLSREVSQLVDVLNTDGADDGPSRKKGRDFYTAGNFGSRLGLVVRQFLTACLVESCVERSVESLSNGQKPVIVIESTMESLMRDLASDRPDRTSDEEVETFEEGGDAPPEGTDAAPPQPPTFRDALRLLVDRTMQMSVRRGREDPVKVPVEAVELVAEAEGIKAMIASFPEVSLSPIDDIRAGIEAAGERLGKGWRCQEVSARGMRVVDGLYVAVPPQDRVATVARFQAGVYDALVLTRAASTGLSLHASEKVADQRPRHMIELQIPSNVVERVQFWGRVKRRGQVCEPTFTTLSTGLPMQNRTLALQNRKVADLSANVTASARSATAMQVPDIIDEVGNAVAKRYLEENPRLADDMMIAMRLKDMETAEAELYHVNKLLQRLVLLPSAEQDRVHREVLAAYEDKLREMRATGKAPRGAREMEGHWEVVASELFEPGDPRDGEVFGRPVTLTTIETVRDRRPLDQAQVEAAIAESNARLGIDGRGLAPFAAHVDAINRGRRDILNALVRKAPNSEFSFDYKGALSSSKPNAVKDADERLIRLKAILQSVRPGLGLSVSGEDGEERGVVVDVRPPADMAHAHQPGRWAIRYVVPGDETPREISAAVVVRGADVNFDRDVGISRHMARAFATALRGKVPERRRVLDGNPVRAVIAARRAGWGSMATWREPSGRLSRAMLVPRSAPQDLDRSLLGRTTAVGQAMAVLEAGGVLWTNQDRQEAGAQVEVRDGFVNVTVPGDRKLSKPYETERLAELLGGWKGAGPVRWSDAPVARAREVLEAVLAGGHAFSFDGCYRQAANGAAATHAPRPTSRPRSRRAQAEEPGPAPGM